MHAVGERRGYVGDRQWSEGQDSECLHVYCFPLLCEKTQTRAKVLREHQVIVKRGEYTAWSSEMIWNEVQI